jgi:hypothetical protein
MSGPMSERAPDITVEADGRAESTTVLFTSKWLFREPPPPPATAGGRGSGVSHSVAVPGTVPMC